MKNNNTVTDSDNNSDRTIGINELLNGDGVATNVSETAYEI